MKIYDETKIYVIAPGFFKTGGTELAHQLVNAINILGIKAYITYYKDGDRPLEINPAFKIYVESFKTLEDVEDVKDNIVIAPETKIGFLSKYSQIRKCVWWMSVDNYLKHDGLISAVKYYGFARAIKRLITGDKFGSHNDINPQYTHFYQSEYARIFLKKKYIDGIRLSDYINIEFGVDTETNERDNVVLYNPKKGLRFTKKLIEAGKDIKWVPLMNMTTEEVHNRLVNSKVYIDFGEHPGKDRFPREAAISGCCVLTGKKGSAAYFEDIPISDEYKFSDVDSNIPTILNKIRECLNEYDQKVKDFDYYRKVITMERHVFEEDVKSIFGVKNRE